MTTTQRRLRILSVAPGTGGGFYCQNCLRDAGLVAGLRGLGADMTVAPMYLPLSADPAEGGGTPLFYGAVRTWLEHRLPVLRALPAPLRRWLDSPALLRLAARRAGSTGAGGLAGLTVSVLRGLEGGQARDLEELLAWAAAGPRPDVVHLSNALLLGLAPAVRDRLGVPVLAGLQDEAGWVDAMAPADAARIWDLMRAQARAAAGFVAVSRTYAALMTARLDLPAGRVHVVPPGVEVPEGPAPEPPAGPPTVGFLARLGPATGLGVLADAVARLRAGAFPALRLAACGGCPADDRTFLRGLSRRLGGAFAVQEDFSPPARRRFLASLVALSVPVPGGEAAGIHLLEANACGVPVVQPRAGSYPEIVEDAGGGLLYDPGAPAALDGALARLLADPGLARGLGLRGRDFVRRERTLAASAGRFLAACRAAMA